MILCKTSPFWSATGKRSQLRLFHTETGSHATGRFLDQRQLGITLITVPVVPDFSLVHTQRAPYHGNETSSLTHSTPAPQLIGRATCGSFGECS